MANGNGADLAEVAAAEDPKDTEQYLVFQANFGFETREMRGTDWRAAGADLTEDEAKQLATTVWSAANAFRVNRKDIPLSDMQLGAFMASNGRFAIIEG